MGVQYPACARRHNCLHLYCLILSFSPSPLQHTRHLYNKHRIPRTCVAHTLSLDKGFLFLALEEFGAFAQPILVHQPTPLDFVFPQHFYSFFPVSALAVFLVCFLSLRFAPALNTSLLELTVYQNSIPICSALFVTTPFSLVTYPFPFVPGNVRSLFIWSPIFHPYFVV